MNENINKEFEFDDNDPYGENDPVHQAQVAEMNRLHNLSQKYRINLSSLMLHDAISRDLKEPTKIRIDLDKILRPGWKAFEKRNVCDLIEMRNVGLIEILETYSFTDHLMIVYPWGYYELSKDFSTDLHNSLT